MKKNDLILVACVVASIIFLMNSAAVFAKTPSRHDIKIMVVDEAQNSIVPPEIALAVAKVESNFNPSALSSAGARGVMQIMPKTGKTLATHLGMHRFNHSSLYDPDVSIRLGSYFLGDQVRQFTNGTTADMGFELGLAAYNAGPHNARQWLERFPHDDADAFIERIPFKETRLYVR